MIQPLNIIIFIFIIGVFLVIVLCKCLDLYERKRMSLGNETRVYCFNCLLEEIGKLIQRHPDKYKDLSIIDS